MIKETYTIDDYIKGTKREAKELITKHIKKIISANNIKEKSPEWYVLYQLKTSVDEDNTNTDDPIIVEVAQQLPGQTNIMDELEKRNGQ